MHAKLRNPRDLRLRVAAGLLAACAVMRCARADDVVAPEALLASLRGKDAAFDNVQLEYVRSGSHEITPEFWDMPAKLRAKQPVNVRPRVVPYRFRDTLVVRGREVTLTNVIDPKFNEARFVPFQKVSNVGNLLREITREKDVGKHANAVLTIRRRFDLPVDVMQEQAMAIEFAHGIGFGRRIRTIDRVEQTAGGLQVEGTIQIWWEDESRFTMLVDEQHLVRSAVIESNVGGNHTRFEVKTAGTVTAQRCELARTGSFKRVALGMEVDGKFLGAAKVAKEFKTEFVELEENLSDEDYAELVDISPERGVQVIDENTRESFFPKE